MLTVVAFLLALGVLITIHELGHYLAARSVGVRVLKFSIGFGRPLFSWQRSPEHTRWVLAAIPLGGYVKMLDSKDTDSANTSVDYQAAFDRQVTWKKMWIVFAGPFANLLLAFCCYWVLLIPGEVGLKPVIGTVQAESVAAKAELIIGEQILSVNHQPVRTWQDVEWTFLQAWLEQPVVAMTTRSESGDLHHHTLQMGQTMRGLEGDPLQAIGLTVRLPQVPAVIGDVVAGSAAAKCGILAGDIIIRVNQKEISDWQQFVKLIRTHPATPLTMHVRRDQQTLKRVCTPEAVTEQGQVTGKFGAAVQFSETLMTAYQVTKSYTPLQAAGKALDNVAGTIQFTLKMLVKMITGQASLKAISGPVSIADAAGQSAALGIKPYIAFVALLSISIAVMNLLPIPVLDGGHLMYHMAEWIRGKPLSDAVLETGQRIGLSVLATLMFIAFFNDLSRLLAG